MFPVSSKCAIISLLIKKQGLDSEILKNYRPVANLSFIPKIIEKLLLPKYRICEIALLRVYNDIGTTIGRGNGVMLVLLYLSAAFDTIDHDNLSDFNCGVPQGSVLGPLK